jgi:hypothetical protein
VLLFVDSLFIIMVDIPWQNVVSDQFYTNYSSQNKEMNLNTTLQYMYIKDRTWTCTLSLLILALVNCQICICYLYWEKWEQKGILVNTYYIYYTIHTIRRKHISFYYIIMTFDNLLLARLILLLEENTAWRILSVYILMSFDFPFVRLFGVR